MHTTGSQLVEPVPLVNAVTSHALQLACPPTSWKPFVAHGVQAPEVWFFSGWKRPATHLAHVLPSR